MCKTFAEVAMEVIREDWELRKEQNNPVFNQERSLIFCFCSAILLSFFSESFIIMPVYYSHYMKIQNKKT